MADQEVVIRGEDGTEHVFPPGFNPLKAAAIVKQQSAQLPSLASMSQPRPAGGYTTSEQPEGWFSKTIRGMLHPTPGQQLAMDVLPFATGAIGSSPNANVGPKTAQAVQNVREMSLPVGQAAVKTLQQKIGVDPDELMLQATRRRLQAARSNTRAARIANDLAQPQATSPAGSTSAGSAPPSPVPVPQSVATAPAESPVTPAPPPAAPPLSGPELKVAGDLARAGYSKSEIAQAIQWRKQGVPSADVLSRLEATRQLQSSGAFAHLPTDFETAQAVTNRNTTDRWPK